MASEPMIPAAHPDTVADAAAQEPVHRLGLLHVGLDRVDELARLLGRVALSDPRVDNTRVLCRFR